MHRSNLQRLTVYAIALCSIIAATTAQAIETITADPSLDQFNPAAARKLIDQHGIDKIAFIKRATMQSSHYYTDHIDGCRFFGTDLCILDLKTGEVTSILPESMQSGIINRMDVSFDATKIVFDWKADDKSGFHIWEINADGTGLHQVTTPPANEKEISDKYWLFKDEPWHWVSNPHKYPVDFGVYGHWTDDMHPCYLPDGSIAFISTRCQYGILCDAPDVLTTTVLYRINPDGSALEKLTNSSVSEANPSVTEDGRIVYTRWEYIDKGASCVKCVWSMRIDGTASAEVYGNDLAMPPSIVHTRGVPGHSNLYVATAAPHCPNTGVGSIIMIDTSKDIRSEEAMTTMTPETTIMSEGWYNHPWIKEVTSRDAPELMKTYGPHFADPLPLDAETMIMACQPDRNSNWITPDGYEISLYEGPGQYTTIYKAGGISCWGPQPLRARPAPPIRVSPRDHSVAEKTLAGQPLATCVVTDVYHGLDGIERGEVKYIRINEQIPRPWSARRQWNNEIDNYDQQHSAVGATHLGMKAQWGIVPVEADGSAHFYVPADRNVFFQVLDENFQELQRERTYINYRPGETRACIGCHETPHDAPVSVAPMNLTALQREPSMPGPQPGEASGQRCLDFEVDVQPIIDRHCIECHNGDNEDTDLDLRNEPTRIFNIAYENLIGFKCSRDEGYEVTRRDMVGRLIREIRPKVGNAEYLPPKTLGSTNSTLVQMLRKPDETHAEVKLTPEELVKITTWIDSNCQYYGSYWGRKNSVDREHPNYRKKVSFEEAISTECPTPEDER